MEQSTTDDARLNCPYCGSLSDLYFPFLRRSYHRCTSCDLIFAKREEDIKTVLAYYRNHYFDDWTRDQMSGQRTNIYRHSLKVLEKYRQPGSLLDVGCGCGAFLKEARERGWQVLGVDPSLKSVEYATALIGNAAVCGTMDDIPADRRFDAVTFINVLDHMVDVWGQLQKAKDLLEPGGILYLRFPSGAFHSFMIRLSQMLCAERFMNYFLIFHEYSLTPKAIRRLLDDAGFTDIRILNAPLTGGNFYFVGRTSSQLIRKILSNLTRAVFKFLETLSGGRWVWGPSLQVVAKKGAGD
jgi:2-polyprenyl-3-methyl-5-hydroxy-6-metoxy-1,4-benzoquinol methylase